MPTSTDNATIAIAGSYQINLTDNQAINQLNFDNAAATLNQSAGTFTVSSAFNLSGTYTLTGGTLTLNGTMTGAVGSTVNFQGATWNGSGNATLNGNFNWGYTTVIDGSGTLSVNGATTLALNGGATSIVGTKTVVLNGGLTWAVAAGTVYVGPTATFRVPSGQVFDYPLAGASSFAPTGGNGGTVDLSGTTRVSGGGTLIFNAGLTYNLPATSTLDIQNGKIVVIPDMTSQGAINVGANGTLQIAGSNLTVATGGSVAGTGVINISSGGLHLHNNAVANAGQLIFSNGTSLGFGVGNLSNASLHLSGSGRSLC